MLIFLTFCRNGIRGLGAALALIDSFYADAPLGEYESVHRSLTRASLF